MCSTPPSLRLQSRLCNSLAKNHGLKKYQNNKRISCGLCISKRQKETKHKPLKPQNPENTQIWVLQWHLSDQWRADKQYKERHKETSWNSNSRVRKEWVKTRLISTRTHKTQLAMGWALELKNKLCKKPLTSFHKAHHQSKAILKNLMKDMVTELGNKPIQKEAQWQDHHKTKREMECGTLTKESRKKMPKISTLSWLRASWKETRPKSTLKTYEWNLIV